MKSSICKIKKKQLVQAKSYSEFNDQRADSVDPDEVAHDEPPNLDLCCFTKFNYFCFWHFNV